MSPGNLLEIIPADQLRHPVLTNSPSVYLSIYVWLQVFPAEIATQPAATCITYLRRVYGRILGVDDIFPGRIFAGVTTVLTHYNLSPTSKICR